MPMNNMPQPAQRFISEQPPTTITLVPSSNTVSGDDESVNDDQTSLSSSTDSQQQKQPTLTQSENQSISKLPSIQSSSSPSSSFLTVVQPSTTDPSSSSTSIEPQQMTSSPNHENETIPFEPCPTSPNPNESLPAPTTQSNIVDELEQ